MVPKIYRGFKAALRVSLGLWAGSHSHSKYVHMRHDDFGNIYSFSCNWKTIAQSVTMTTGNLP